VGIWYSTAAYPDSVFTGKVVRIAPRLEETSRQARTEIEIPNANNLIKPGMIVVDLGASPGGWSQVVAEVLKGKGKIFALDILPMEPIQNVEFLQGDFREEKVMQTLLDAIEGEKVDLVLLDILMPEMSGDKVAQQIRQDTKLKNLKIAFLSVVELGDQGKKLVKDYKAIDYITKPVKPDDLKKRLAKILK